MTREIEITSTSDSVTTDNCFGPGDNILNIFMTPVTVQQRVVDHRGGTINLRSCPKFDMSNGECTKADKRCSKSMNCSVNGSLKDLQIGDKINVR